MAHWDRPRDLESRTPIPTVMPKGFIEDHMATLHDVSLGRREMYIKNT